MLNFSLLGCLALNLHKSRLGGGGGAGLKVGGGFCVEDSKWWWVCKPISLLSLGQAEQN